MGHGSSDDLRARGLFAGEGNVGKVWRLGSCLGLPPPPREAGRSVAQYDSEYSRGMDFLSRGGFALCPQLYLRACVVSVRRCAMYLVLSLVPHGLVLMGPCCSSWTVVSRGTSQRSVVNPSGNRAHQWVCNANLMISRPGLQVCTSPILKQPCV